MIFALMFYIFCMHALLLTQNKETKMFNFATFVEFTAENLICSMSLTMLEIIKSENKLVRYQDSLNNFVLTNSKAYSALFMYPFFNSSSRSILAIADGFRYIDKEDDINTALELWTNALDIFNADEIRKNIDFYFDELLDEFFGKSESSDFVSTVKMYKEYLLNTVTPKLHLLRKNQLDYYDAVFNFDLKLQNEESVEILNDSLHNLMRKIHLYQGTSNEVLEELKEKSVEIYSLFNNHFVSICSCLLYTSRNGFQERWLI